MHWEKALTLLLDTNPASTGLTKTMAPAHLNRVGSHTGELIIDVVGTLPAQMNGWSLLLG